MAIREIVTLGYGASSSVYFIPTLGFGLAPEPGAAAFTAIGGMFPHPYFPSLYFPHTYFPRYGLGAPDVPGIEFTAPKNPLHFTAASNRMHWTAPANPLTFEREEN